MTTKLQAKFDGKVLVPLQPVDLPSGEVLDIEVHSPSGDRNGSPAAILRALQSLPPLPEEYFEDLERAIEEAKLPVRHEGVFDEK
jgi:predicted DNA-binding antitoxin AbrB/MazE fold protein